MLISYHTLVRYTFVGAILNGRRHERRRPKANGHLVAAAAK
jgi:hypothetical protein